MAKKTSKATAPKPKKIACFGTKKTAQKAAAAMRKLTGRKTIKADGACVVIAAPKKAAPKKKAKAKTKTKRSSSSKFLGLF